MPLFNIPEAKDVYNIEAFEAWYKGALGEPETADEVQIKAAAQLAWAVSRGMLLKQAFGIDMEVVAKERAKGPEKA